MTVIWNLMENSLYRQAKKIRRLEQLLTTDIKRLGEIMSVCIDFLLILRRISAGNSAVIG